MTPFPAKKNTEINCHYKPAERESGSGACFRTAIATARAMPIFGSNRGVLVVTRLTVRSGLHAEVASQRLRTNFRARQLADQPAILDQDSVVSEVQHGVDLLLDQNYCNAVFSELASHIP